MPIPDQTEFTNSVIDLLQRGTGFLVGDHKAPVRGTLSDEEYYPYCVVFCIPGGRFYGSLAGPDEAADFVYQVTSVGRTRIQAQACADRVRRTWLARSGPEFQVQMVTPQGWSAPGRMPQNGFAGMIDREGEPPYEIWNAPERFILQVTPIGAGA